jgi:hypothetical protein
LFCICLLSDTAKSMRSGITSHHSDELWTSPHLVICDLDHKPSRALILSLYVVIRVFWWPSEWDSRYNCRQLILSLYVVKRDRAESKNLLQFASPVLEQAFRRLLAWTRILTSFPQERLYSIRCPWKMVTYNCWNPQNKSKTHSLLWTDRSRSSSATLVYASESKE